jgi:hypothetical protein
MDKLKLFWRTELIPLLFWVLIGVLSGAVIVFAANKSLALGVIVPLALIGAVLVLLKPDLGMLIFLFTLLVIDEFPSGLGETSERSMRTAFYGTSIGIPGVYSTDVFVFGLLTIYLFRSLLLRINLNFPADKASISLLSIGAMAVISVVAAFAGGNPFAFYQYHIENTATSFDMNARGAQLIAMFQYKTFSFFFLAYFLGLFFIDSPKKIKMIIYLFFFAVAVNIAVGFVRIGMIPSILTEMKPLFYHSPSSWIFALAIFGTILGTSYRLLSKNQMITMVACSVVLLLFILLSFRRTMWVAIFLAGIVLLFYLPSKFRTKLIVVASLLLTLMLVLIMMTPLGEAIVNRISETNFEDASTLYRIAIFNFMVDNFLNLPFLGYGPKPLWDVKAQLGGFETNMENVHSFYYWYFLRHGLIGFSIFLVAFGAILIAINSFIKHTRDPIYRVIGTSILLALFMLLFSGLFNPVYGEVRYMILMGVSLAIFSRMMMFEKKNLYIYPLSVKK